MVQSRTHTCNQLRMEHVGQKVTIVVHPFCDWRCAGAFQQEWPACYGRH